LRRVNHPTHSTGLINLLAYFGAIRSWDSRVSLHHDKLIVPLTYILLRLGERIRSWLIPSRLTPNHLLPSFRREVCYVSFR